MSVRLASAVAMAALLLPAGAAAAPGAGPGLSDLQRYGRCAALTGPRVVETKRARVVTRRVHERPAGPGVERVGRRFLGCARPDGIVHPLGDAGRAYHYDPSVMPSRLGLISVTRRSVSAASGRFVIVRARSQPGFAEGRVVDLATGSGYPVYGGTGSEPQELSTVPPVAWALSPLGLFAGIYPDLADDGTRAHSVRAFTERGAQKLLARAAEPDIPIESLSLTGRTVGWTEAGLARTAEVTELTPAYAPGLELE